MKVALFVPCFMDVFYGKASMATYRLLERLGVEVLYPSKQTCCGQAHANRGCGSDARRLASKFLEDFLPLDVDYIVSPSGSCTSTVRHTYGYYLGEKNENYLRLREKTFELCEFLVDILKIEKLPTRVHFAREVSVHYNCHALRHLGLGIPSERVVSEEERAKESKVEHLLSMVEGLSVLRVENPDECCGFGGLFSIKEAEVSSRMGMDRLKAHQKAGSNCIVSTDTSCFMHLEGLQKRGKLPIEFYHIAEILVWGGNL